MSCMLRPPALVGPRVKCCVDTRRSVGASSTPFEAEPASETAPASLASVASPPALPPAALPAAADGPLRLAEAMAPAKISAGMPTSLPHHQFFLKSDIRVSNGGRKR